MVSDSIGPQERSRKSENRHVEENLSSQVVVMTENTSYNILATVFAVVQQQGGEVTASLFGNTAKKQRKFRIFRMYIENIVLQKSAFFLKMSKTPQRHRRHARK